MDVRPIVHEGRAFVLLRDPLQLSDKLLIVPHELLAILALCDGTREDARALRASFELRFGLNIQESVIDELLRALDETMLLDNARYLEACDCVLGEYRQAPFRPPALAGTSYPADRDELRSLLDGFGSGPGRSVKMAARSSDRFALVSPHIDYARGGPVYAEVWMRANELVRAADLVVVFGTDHYGGDGELTLTRQNYATPFGILPTATAIVDELAEAIGVAAFDGELRHRGEHSIELATAWLQYALDGNACEMVPILCGSFASFIRGDADEKTDSAIQGIIEVLRARAKGRRVLYVAAADLAHIGPAFGGEPVDLPGRASLKEADDELIEHICAGNPHGFLAAIKRVQDCNNVCGVSPIYMMLRMIEGSRGIPAGYDRCPADEDGTSLVSICGVVFDGSN